MVRFLCYLYSKVVVVAVAMVLDNADNTLAWLAAKISDNEEWRTLDGKTITGMLTT